MSTQTNVQTASDPAVACTDLLGCPFCFSCNLEVCKDEDSDFQIWSVHCKKCGAVGPPACRSKAVREWNRRRRPRVAKWNEDFHCTELSCPFCGRVDTWAADEDVYCNWCSASGPKAKTCRTACKRWGMTFDALTA